MLGHRAYRGRRIGNGSRLRHTQEAMLSTPHARGALQAARAANAMRRHRHTDSRGKAALPAPAPAEQLSFAPVAPAVSLLAAPIVSCSPPGHDITQPSREALAASLERIPSAGRHRHALPEVRRPRILAGQCRLYGGSGQPVLAVGGGGSSGLQRPFYPGRVAGHRPHSQHGLETYCDEFLERATALVGHHGRRRHISKSTGRLLDHPRLTRPSGVFVYKG